MIQSKIRNLSPIRKKKVNDSNLNNNDENTYFENINILGMFDYPNNIYNNTKNYISNLFTSKVNKKSTVRNLTAIRVGKNKVNFYIGNENEQINQNRNYESNNLDYESNNLDYESNNLNYESNNLNYDSNYYNSNNSDNLSNSDNYNSYSNSDNYNSNSNNYSYSDNDNIITEQINDKYPNTLRLSNKYHNGVSRKDYDMSLFDDYLDENDDLNKNIMDMFNYINNVCSNTKNCIYYSFKRIFD